MSDNVWSDLIEDVALTGKVLNEYFDKFSVGFNNEVVKPIVGFVGDSLNVVEYSLKLEKNLDQSDHYTLSITAAGTSVIVDDITTKQAFRTQVAVGLGLIITPEPVTTAAGVVLLISSPFTSVLTGNAAGNVSNYLIMESGKYLLGESINKQKFVVPNDANEVLEISSSNLTWTTTTPNRTIQDVLQDLDTAGYIPSDYTQITVGELDPVTGQEVSSDTSVVFLGNYAQVQDINEELHRNGDGVQLQGSPAITNTTLEDGSIISLVHGNPNVTDPDGNLISLNQYSSMVGGRNFSTAEFLSKTFEDVIDVYSAAVTDNSATTIAHIAARLIAGEDINDVVEEYVTLLTADGIANSVYEQLVLQEDVAGYIYETHWNTHKVPFYPDSNGKWTLQEIDPLTSLPTGNTKTITNEEAIASLKHDYTHKALIQFAVNAVINEGDYAQALENTSVQLVINEGLKSYDALTRVVRTDSVTGEAVLGLNPTGAGLAAAAIVLTGNLISEGEISEQAVGQSIVAGSTAYAVTALTPVLVGTSTSTGLLGLNGAYAGPVGIVVGAVLGLAVQKLFSGSKVYHDETISHKTEEQADGSLLITGLREAGSLLRTSTTDDDVMGNDGGHDTIVGQSGQNELYGLGGDDYIEGRANDDYIEGGSGNDHIEAGGQNDFADGGTGNDRVMGGRGDDNVLGGDGEDIVLGGDGNDNVEGNVGNDRLYGGRGDDTLLGGAGADLLDGGLGDDVLSGEAGNDTIDGGQGNDTLRGDDGADALFGGDGNDDLKGGNDDDALFGDGGVDQLYGGAGNDTIDGGLDADIAFGGIGDDMLHGSYADDSLFGEIGNDLLIGGRGNDTQDGGEGNDVYLYNKGDGQDTLTDTDGVNTLKFLDLNSSDIASISQVGNDLVLTIDSLNSVTVTNQFTTTGLSDIEFADGQQVEISNMTFDEAGVGSYTLATGTDVLSTVTNQYGRYNQITMSFSASTALSTDWLTNNYDINVTTDSYDAELYNDVQVKTWTKTAGFFGMRFSMGYYDYHERLLQGSGGADRIVGMWWDETINGFSNNDQLYGNGANDTIQGGIDHDLMYGGSGNDTINGEIGADKGFGGIGDDTLNGGDGNDTLFGEWGDDIVKGESGDDYLSGGSGNDIIIGGIGRDISYGGTGNDTISGGTENDFLNGGIGADTLNGDEGDDLLFGSDGNDNLQGGAGDDILIGSEGNDNLDGGDGTDTIILAGTFQDYDIFINAEGYVTITDLRTESLDGIDTAFNVELLQFADQTIDLRNQPVKIQNIILPQNSSFSGQVILPEGYSISLDQDSANGTAIINPDGSYSFTSSEYAGRTDFEYRLTDPEGITINSKVDVFVSPLSTNLNPYIHNTEQNVSSGTYVDASSPDYRSQTTALTNGGHVVVWRARNEQNTAELNLYYRVYDASGEAVTTALLAPSHETGIEFYGHVSALSDGGFLLSWYENDGKAKWRAFDSSGNATTTDISFINPSSNQSNHTSGAHIVELNNGNLGGVWIANNQIYFSEYSTAGNRIGTAQPVISGIDVNEAHYLDVTRLTNGSLAVTWSKTLSSLQYDHDVRTAIISDTGVLVGSIQDVYIDPDGGSHYTPRYQQLPHVAGLNDGSYVVLFTSTHDYNKNNIYFMRYDADGSALTTTPILVNDSSTSGDQYSNGITALADGGFIVTWDVNHSYSLHARRYDASGNSVGNEFQINDTNINNQPWSDITSLNNGDLIITWNKNNAGNFEVVQKRLKPNDVYLNIIGGNSDEIIVTDNSEDIIKANDGDDIIIDGHGSDIIDGGAGNDTVRFNGNFEDYSINIDNQTITVTQNQFLVFEDFQNGAIGWRDNTVTDGGTNFTKFLGRFGSSQNTNKTFDIPDNTNQITITFDLYEIDSWDNEEFIVTIDDQQIFSETFHGAQDDTETNGQTDNVSWSISPITYSQHLGFEYGNGENWWKDQIHQVTLTLTNPGEDLKLGFSSTLNQVAEDESFGIDNLSIQSDMLQEETYIITNFYDDFESGAIGWSDNTVTDGGTNFTNFLGRFANTQSTYRTFDIPDGGNKVIITFDLYEIDSWDNEEFIVTIDDQQVFYETFHGAQDDTETNGQTDNVSWNISPITYSQHLGFEYRNGENWWKDQIHQVTLTVTNPGEDLKLGFSSTLNQSIDDEAFGIDNLLIQTELSTHDTNTLFNIENLAFNDQAIEWDSLFDDLKNIIIGQSNTLNGQINLQTGDIASLSQEASHGTVIIQEDGTYSYTSSNSYTGNDSFSYDITTSSGIQRTVTVDVHIIEHSPEGIIGSDHDEILLGTNGSDILSGAGGDDIFIAGVSNDMFDGGSGDDVALFSGDFPDYSISFDNNILNILDNRTGSPDGLDTLSNIEILKFSDQDIIVSNLFENIPDFILPQNEEISGQLELTEGHMIGLVSDPSQGTLTLNENGNYHYNAPDNFSGVVNFTYQITTPNGLVKQQTSDITILRQTPGDGDFTHGIEQNVSSGTYVDASSMDYRSQTTALANGGHVVVWRARNEQNTSELNLYYRVYNANGEAITTALLAPAHETGIELYGHVSLLNDGGFLLSWYENDGKAKWRAFDSSGNATTGDISFIAPTSSQGNHSTTGAHILELNNGNLGGVWIADNQLYFGEFDRSGIRVSSASTVTDIEVNGARHLDVTMLTNGNLALTWEKTLPHLLYDHDVRTAVISETGELISNVQDVFIDADGGAYGDFRYQQIPQIAALKDGSYVVLFTSTHNHNENNIYFMRYDSNGSALTTNPVLVNDTSISGSQFSNSIITLADGGFMVTWDVNHSYSLHARRYDASGNSIGNEFQVNDTNINNQPWSDITSLNNGDIIITWNKNNAGNFEVVQKRLIAPQPDGISATGNDSDELLFGSSFDDALNGANGNDTLSGKAGNDVLSGGEGNDIYLFNVGDGSDTIINQDATGFDIVLFGQDINLQDIWFSQSGYDLILSLINSDDKITFQNWFTDNAQRVSEFQLDNGFRLPTDAISDLINTMANFNPLTLGTINELSNLPQVIENSIIAAWTAIDGQIIGSDNYDTITGTTENDIILGLQGNDIIYGGDGTDRLHGGDGDDSIHGQLGNDIMYGDSGNDIIHGWNGNNILYGGIGNDHLYGQAGDDILNGEDGNDYLDGATGSDTLNGGEGDDILKGWTENDFLQGGHGNDSLYGHAGNDNLYGGDGNDLLIGGSGQDRMFGGSGDDIIYYTDTDIMWENGAANDVGGTGRDRVIVESGSTYYTNALNLYGIEEFIGASGNDVVRAQSHVITDHYFEGNSGDDELVGGSGNDVILGGQGNDRLVGRDGNDTLTGGTGNDTLLGYNGADIMNGEDGDDYLDGAVGADIINGGPGNDILYGWTENDILNGGTGDDILEGHGGNDTYLFNLGDGSDTVSNEDSSGHDVIQFGSGIERNDIWFEQSDNNLLVNILNSNGDTIIFSDWFVHDSQRVDEFQLDDGHKLNKNNVSNLLNEMEQYDPDILDPSEDLPTDVQSAISDWWLT